MMMKRNAAVLAAVLSLLVGTGGGSPVAADGVGQSDVPISDDSGSAPTELTYKECNQNWNGWTIGWTQAWMCRLAFKADCIGRGGSHVQINSTQAVCSQ